jgi:hypothetical protein
MKLLSVLFAWASLAAAPLHAEEPKLLGHWPLNGTVRDISPNRRDAVNHRADLDATGRDGKPRGAAGFNGRDSHLAVPVRSAPSLGPGDFTLALWVHTDETLDDDLGDLVSQYDPSRRKGFTLALRCNTGVTSSQPNYRHLQFGIDDGAEPAWRDEGRPGQAILAFALAVHDGSLYAGTCEPGKDESGRVYRYDGPGRWSDCGAPDRANAITSLAVHEGRLYAASAKYRLAGSALPESANPHKGGRVFRHEGGQKWTDCGQLPDTEAVGGLAVYRGRLYASSLYRPAVFFRYEGGQKWTSLPPPGGKRVGALGVHNGFVWATGYDEGHVYRYDGRAWEDLGRLGDNTQTYSFAVLEGELHAGTWPSGKVFRRTAAGWEERGRLGSELEVMGMLVHNGKLYAGTLPAGAVFRFDEAKGWTRVGHLDRTPEVRYRRVWTMAQYQGRLFCTTLPSGHIHSLQTGPCVTYDRELPPGWRHVAAVRDGGRLRLYVDGRRVAESAPFDPGKFDLSSGQPLRIGAGPGDRFRGRISDVRLYGGALGDEDMAALGRSRP